MTAPTSEFSKRDQVALASTKMHLTFGLLRSIVWAAVAVLTVYFSPALIVPLAGKDTLVALNVAILGDIKFVVSIGLTGAAGVWAIVERSLRHRKVEYLQSRIKELETTIDKNRTSSKLTTKGKTNPRDKS